MSALDERPRAAVRQSLFARHRSGLTQTRPGTELRFGWTAERDSDSFRHVGHPLFTPKDKST